ncbi:uncharacterized protein LY89DRAFT_695255 [Mollisia scopiformis]|uniref:CHCH domain-containing protein n=1 Tax=Mollisia scopiformis TaxID=149040 RepID=A0A194XKD7_MOLSC|nr:uncharacterized protein LY89DRAFT_695255 [Mollisia scopiformis]KUJ20675.1 hypothetical protein LY89DRAFT_695255 [Mollisia scopiformis]
MSKSESDSKVATAVEDDDEPDDWDKRIFSTGCSVENAKMTDCYFEKKDWRQCKDELETFRKCWKQHQNDERTDTKDA